MNHYIITKSEDTLLHRAIDNFITQNGGRIALAEKLECEWAEKPFKVEKVENSNIGAWTKQEIDFIIEDYPFSSVTEMANYLGRPFIRVKEVVNSLILTGKLQRKRKSKNN